MENTLKATVRLKKLYAKKENQNLTAIKVPERYKHNFLKILDMLS